MSVTIEGLEEVLARLDKIGDADKIVDNLSKACALVEGEARRNAPKDTGALARSIESRVEVFDDEVDGVVFTPLEYAPYVEYGTGLFAESGGRMDVPWNYQDDEGNWHSTSGQKPQPFMRPALDDNREKVLKILKEGILGD